MAANQQLQVRLEVGWGSTPSTTPSAVDWRDETPRLRLADGISATRGRSDERSTVTAGTMTCSLDNRDNRYTVDNTRSPLYPNVTLRRPIRLRALTSTADYNLLSANDASFETSIGAWVTGLLATPAATLTRSTTRAWTGSAALRVQWPNSAAALGSVAGINLSGLAIGRKYVVSAYAWVTAGDSAVNIAAYFVTSTAVGATPMTTTTTGAWQRIACTFTATATTQYVVVANASATPTSGTQDECWIDGVQVHEGSTSLQAFSTAAQPIADVWNGFISEIDEQWINGVQDVVTVTAADAMTQLGLATFDTLLYEAHQYQDPIAFWPLDGKPKTTTWADRSGNAQPALLRVSRSATSASAIRTGVSSNPAWDTTWLIGGDVNTASQFVIATATTGYYMKNSAAISTGTAFGCSFTAMVNASAGAEGLLVGADDSAYLWYIYITAAGYVSFRQRNLGTGVVTTLGTTATSITDDAWHAIAVTFSLSGGTVTWTVYVDGASALTGTYAAAFTPTVQYVYAGGSGVTALLQGFISNVALFDRALALADVQAIDSALDGYVGDTSKARFERIADYAGFPKSSSGTPAYTMGAQPFYRRSAAELLAEVAEAENGSRVYVSDSGTLTYRAPSVPAAFVIDAKDVQFGSPMTLSDQWMVNEVEASRVNGTTVTRRSGSSITAYGRKKLELSLYLNDDTSLQTIADAIVSKRAQPVLSAGSLAINLTTSDSTVGASTLTRDLIGCLMSITGLPRGSATTIAGIIEGYTDSITHTGWTRSFNLSPGSVTDLLSLEATWWIDAGYATDSQTVTNKGTGGTALNATLGSSASADSNDPKFLAYEGTPYVYLPGVAGNVLRVPDAANLDLAGDMDVAVRVALDDWTSLNTLMARWQSSFSFFWYVNATGYLNLYFLVSTTGYDKVSTAAVPFSDGSAGWVRFTRSATSGDIKFYTASDSPTVPTSWTQLGTTVASPAGAIDASASTLQVGEYGNGGYPLSGKVYQAIYRDGINGTAIVDISTSALTSGSSTSFTATSGQTVTIARSTSGRKAVAVVGPLWLLGTDDYLEVADNALLDFSSTDSFTVLWVGRQWATIGGTLISKQTQASPYDGVAIRDWYGAAYYRWLCVQDGGPTSADVQSPAFTAGNMTVVTGVVNRSTQKATAYVGTSASSDVSTSSVGGFSNSYPLRIGRTSGGTEYYGNVEFIAAAVFRRVLTAAEIAAITSYYQSRYA